MARAKNLSTEHCFETIEGINKTWYDDFFENTENATYHKNIERFLRIKIFNHKPFNLFEASDIIEFYDILEKLDSALTTRNNYISAITAFKEYLSEKYKSDF